MYKCLCTWGFPSGQTLILCWSMSMTYVSTALFSSRGMSALSSPLPSHTSRCGTHGITPRPPNSPSQTLAQHTPLLTMQESGDQDRRSRRAKKNIRIHILRATAWKNDLVTVSTHKKSYYKQDSKELFSIFTGNRRWKKAALYCSRREFC